MKSSMFSTIDASRLFALLRFGGAAGGILAIWTAIAGLAALAEPTSTVTIFGPQTALMQAIKTSDVQLLNAGRGFMIVQGRTSGFVGALYSAGAWAVLPGGIGACASANLLDQT
jgi:D-serine dehydratase